MYNFLASVSSQQKFETMDEPVLQPGVIASNGSVLLPCVSSSDRPVLQLCVTAQFYLERGQADPTDVKRRKSSGPILAPPPEPALCKLGQPGGLFVSPEALTPVLGLSFVLCSQAFALFAF